METLDGMTSDEIAKKIMNILDESDDGSKAPIAQNAIDMKIDDLCTLELATSLMSFMRSNIRSTTTIDLPGPPAYQECCHEVMLMIDEEKKKVWRPFDLHAVIDICCNAIFMHVPHHLLHLAKLVNRSMSSSSDPAPTVSIISKGVFEDVVSVERAVTIRCQWFQQLLAHLCVGDHRMTVEDHSMFCHAFKALFAQVALADAMHETLEDWKGFCHQLFLVAKSADSQEGMEEALKKACVVSIHSLGAASPEAGSQRPEC